MILERGKIMGEMPGNGESPEELRAEIKRLNISLKKAERKIKRLQQDKDYIAALNEQAYKMRDFYEAEYKQQFMYSSLILQKSPDILFIMGLDLKILLVTSSFLNTFGKTKLDIENGMYLKDVLKEKMQAVDWNELKEIYKSLSEGSLECEKQIALNLPQVGQRIFETHASMIMQNDFSGYVITMSDVTEMVMEREKAESADRAKSDFLANMSHEIRTPMNAISGMAEFIIRDTGDEEARENARQIKSACRSLIAIINDILDFSKIEAGKMELVPVEYQISSAINDVVNMISIRLQHKPVELLLDIDETMPYCLYGDEIRLRQILVNILNNAVKFTEKGSICLKMWYKLNKQKDEITIYSSIEDSGIGIKKEDLEKLFSSFNQVDTKKNRSIEGTGLGLAISKRLAMMMGGDIIVESEYGHGTIFTFWVCQKVLDYKPMGRVKREDIINSQEAFANSFIIPSAKILIVDDNLINLKVAKGMLMPYKCKLFLASSGREAIDMANAGNFDIIFMDHMMPVMDGMEAMQEIRRLPGKGNTVIIALTANAISGVREKYKSAGFNDFLAKPIEAEKLEQLLNDYIPERMKEASDGKQISPVIDDDILRQAYSDGLKKIKLLRCLFEEKDYERYTIEVHALKSVAAVLGEMELSRQAKDHEMAGREGNYTFIEENFESLIKNYEDLTARLGEKYGTGGEDEELLNLSDSEVNELFEKLFTAVDEFDMAAAGDVLLQLSHANLKEKQDIAAEMKEAAEEFDYDRLEKLAGELKNVQ